MEERQVTSTVRAARSATAFWSWPPRTPVEYEGTYPLPEAQLDRFLL